MLHPMERAMGQTPPNSNVAGDIYTQVYLMLRRRETIETPKAQSDRPTGSDSSSGADANLGCLVQRLKVLGPSLVYTGRREGRNAAGAFLFGSRR